MTRAAGWGALILDASRDARAVWSTPLAYGRRHDDGTATMDTVRIERFSSRVEADLACSMLTAQGFNARVSGDDVAGVHPDIPFGIGGTAVVVPREQYDDAIALLDEEFAGPLGDAAEHRDTAGSGDGPQHTTPAGALSDAPGADDAEWAGETQRRPGVRVFAVVAAAAFLVVFLAATGSVVGWW